MTVRGELIGAVEISDARARDLTGQVPVVAGLARICAHALDVEATYNTLEQRDKAIRELVDLSQEVAQTHELGRFVERFALRLMAAVNADCVDVYFADHRTAKQWGVRWLDVKIYLERNRS